MKHHISVPRTARYQQLGELSATTKQLWLVLHGYGQLAEYFIRHFAALHAADSVGTVIVAPEGLSRFYLNGTSGRVGASWMTRADRLAEIDDQHTYLTAVLRPMLTIAPAADVIILGFSQGTATASRWLAHLANTNGWRPRRLILWAGDFPTDTLPAPNLLAGLPVDIVCGDQDVYSSYEQVRQQADILESYSAFASVFRFSGGHTLNTSLLHELADY